MQLSQLVIRRRYTDDLEGYIEVTSGSGRVTLNLTNSQAQALVAVVADALVDTARVVARDITAEMVSGQAQKAVEAQP